MIAWQYCIAVCCRAGWINCNIHTSSAPWPPSPDTNALIPVVTERRAGSLCGAAGPTLSALPTAGHLPRRWLSPTLLPQCPQAGPLGLCLHSCPAERCISASALESIFTLMHDTWVFGFWLTSFCATGSGFIHLTSADSKPFLFMAEWYSIIYF